MKKKTCFQSTAVLFMVLFLAWQGMAADTYTSSRSLVFGGSTGMFNRNSMRYNNTFDDKNRTFEFDLFGGYFISDNLAMGIKAGYSYSRSHDTYTIDGAMEADYTFKDHLFKTGLFLRNYFRLSRVLYFFIETEAVAGFGSVEQSETSFSPLPDETGKLFTLEIGFTPGLVFFINRGLAVEARVGFTGLTYQRYKSDNPEYGIEYSTTELDFGFDVDSLRIQLGISIYL